MKYIRHKHMGFVLFEATQKHSDMADWLKLRDEEIISAGIVAQEDWIEDGEMYCHGHSMTLKKHALKEDTDLLRRQFKGAY